MRIRNSRIVALGLALAMSIALWAQNSLTGKWSTAVQVNGQSITIESVYSPQGSYSEVTRAGTLATSQSGTFVFKDGTLTRTVKDWEPKRQWIVDATPGTGHYENTAQPPGGVYRVTFTNPDTAVFTDVNFHGTATFHRAK
jgi:hypothetical protein